MNEYVLDEPLDIPLLQMDIKGEERQVERLRRVRSERDNEEASRCLKALESACQSSDNLMPYLLTAVQANCTLGEVCNVMRNVWGEYQEPTVL